METCHEEDSILEEESLKVVDPQLKIYRVQSQLCHKLGHTVLDCFYRFNKSFTGAFPPSKSPSVQENLAQTNSIGDSNWYPDSGTTNHCTPDLQNLMNNSDYGGSDRLYVGNGSAYVSDLCGSAFTVSHNGYKYYMSFVDACTRFTWVYLLKNKSEALRTFLNFKTETARIANWEKDESATY
uniref:Uncharacterized protein n=1 Tax=Cannabis sativa TaxID=3483 RepID=A0A803Q7A1_CANSA